MFKFLDKLFGPIRPSKYILEPDDDGRYKLKRYDGSVGLYFFETTVKNKEEARRAIKNLERETIHLDP
jgi:hypothetical protein